MPSPVSVSPIVSYTVRRRGVTAWADDIATEQEARIECAKANRIVEHGHRVYAVHADGSISDIE